MRLEDVSQQTALATTPPEEAVKNINNSQAFNISPDKYKESAKELDPEISKMLDVNFATPFVAEQIKTSEQHASALKPVVENLNYVERIWGHAQEQWKKRGQGGPVRELTDLQWKMLDKPDTMTEDEMLRLGELNVDQEGDFGAKNYGITGFWESLPGDIAGEISNLSGIAKRNKEVFALSAATGVGLGLARGSVGGLPGLVVGAGTGLITGSLTGYRIASSLDAFRDTAAGTYGEILKDTETKMSEDEKRSIAYGVGVTSSALEFVADAEVIKSVPYLKKYLGGKAAREAIKSGTFRKVMGTLGAAFAEGGTEGAQELISVLAEELTGTFDNANEEFRFMNALESAANKISSDPKTQERLAKSVTVGAAMGGGFSAAANIAPKVIKKGGEGISKIISRDSKSMPINDTVQQRAMEGAALEDSLSFSVETLNSPKFNALPKENKVKLLAGVMDKYGLDGKVWVSAKAREYFGANPDRLAKVQKILDRNNLTPDAPIQFTTQEFADLVIDYPDAAEWAQAQAEGMGGRGAREFVEQNKAYQSKKAELKSKYDLGEKSPDEIAYSLKVTNNTQDEDLAKALSSKEVAEAYLSRLDVEESVIMEKAAGQPLDAEQVEVFNDIQDLRNRVKAMAPQLPDHKTVQDLLKRAFDEDPNLAEISSLEDYVERPTFTEAIEGVLSDAEVAKINEASTSARQMTADNIMDAAIYEMNQVRDEVYEQGLEVQEQIETEKVMNDKDPDVNLVEKFIEQAPDKKVSRFAIDPKTLTPEQKRNYRENTQLKKHKAWAKGGMSPDEAAQMLGVKDGETLLKILSKTQSRKEMIAQAVERRKGEINQRAIDAVPLNDTAIVKAANNMTANHIAEMKYLVSEKWSATKRAIKRVVKPLPKIEVIQKQAADVVAQTKLKDLSVSKFKIGERRAQNRASDAVLAGDLELAFDAKEQAALNSALQAETQKAIATANRLRKLAKRFRDPSVIRTLKSAGMLDAANELLDIFNIDGSKKGTSKRDSYVKYVESQLAIGQGNFEIPAKFFETIKDPRSTFGDMTAEEAAFVHTRLKQLLKMAERKNELNLRFGDPAKELQTFDNMVRQLVEVAESHPDFDKSRNKNKFTDKIGMLSEPLKRVASSAWSSLKNIEHITLLLDKHQVAGKFSEAIVAPLKGDGNFGHMGDAGKTRDWIALKKHFEENVIKFFGEKEWRAMATNRFVVPEFKDVVRKVTNDKGDIINETSFNDDGSISEASLFMMMLNDGNDSNAQRLQNFGVDIETIRKVYRRHLTEKHGIAAQRIFDTFKTYFPRVQELQERTTGETVQFIEGRPFEVGGKVFPGGYYPLTYESDLDRSRRGVKSNQDEVRKALEGEKKYKMRDYYYADDMTRHNHTESRENVVTEKLLNLNMSTIGSSFDGILHDLNFREAVAQSLKVVADPQVSKAIIATVGEADYNALFNNIVDAAKSNSIENDALFNSSEMFDYFASRVRSGASVAYLVGNAASIAIQPVSVTYSVDLMGANSAMHMGEILQTVVMDPTIWSSLEQTAAEINPAIKSHLENLDDNIRNQLHELMPKNYRNDVTKMLSHMQESINKMGFGALGLVDFYSKVIVTTTAYKQFLAGDAKGFDFETLNKMSKEEIRQKATEYANSVARLTLTSGARTDRAGIQKSKWMILNTAFWNDARNTLQNTMRKVREVKWEAKDKNYFGASTSILSLLIVSGIARTYLDLVRGNKIPFLKGEDDDDEVDLLEVAGYFASAPLDITLGNIPGVRNAYYYASTKEWNKAGVTDLGTQAMTSGVNTIMIVNNWLQAVMHGEEIKLKKKDMKDIGMTASILTGGVPVNLLTKFITYLNSKPQNDFYIKPLTQELSETVAAVEKKREAGEIEIPDDIWEQIQKVEKEANPVREPQSIPEDTFDVIKRIESDGKWYAKNPNSSAAGLYQFTEGTWEDIMERAPELGLTKGGRVSSDPSEQEDAMKWYTEQNAEALTGAGLEPTLPNIYAAHFLGAKGAIKVLSASGDTKLKTLVDEESMEANSLKKGMKVKEFKAWLDNKVASAKTTS